MTSDRFKYPGIPSSRLFASPPPVSTACSFLPPTLIPPPQQPSSLTSHIHSPLVKMVTRGLLSGKMMYLMVFFFASWLLCLVGNEPTYSFSLSLFSLFLSVFPLSSYFLSACTHEKAFIYGTIVCTYCYSLFRSSIQSFSRITLKR